MPTPLSQTSMRSCGRPCRELRVRKARILDVGLRSAYVASWYAAPLMVKQKNVSISLMILRIINVLMDKKLIYQTFCQI